ncbi:MAG: CRTAC1 family protein [Gammaproteobacteria bacterium]|nr:CRTAC1 family protein [Gammaproteobacteria bacterium]
MRMKNNNRGDATDEIIGIAFRRFLVTAAISVAVIALVVLLYRGLGEDEVQLDTPPVSPVTVHRAVQAPAVHFSDITRAAGIDFSHSTGAYGDKLLPETMGSGAAFFDFDNDADQDLLLINSDFWPDHVDAGVPRPTMKLYANDGSGQFSDVTQAAGLAVPIYGMGVAVADYDNDGDADIFVTAYGVNRLFRNDGGHYVDATDDAGVGGAADAWSTSAGFLDIDNDGDLDLFVANYVQWSREIDFNINYQLTGIGRAYGPPNAYQGTYNYLYRNDGTGRFEDISAASGIQVNNPSTGEPMGKALAVVPVDIDGDGWLDVLVANDTVQNFFFHNRGDGIFEERGAALGLAFDRDGKATGAMGVDAAYFRNDPELGFAVGNFANEMTSLYVTRDAGPPLTDEAIVEGIGPASRLALTFGLFFFDYDLDGRLDLLQANGHLERDINKVQSSQHFRQAPQLFWNCGDDCRSSFLVQPAEANGDFATPLVGRGASYADIDADGDLDVIITQNGGAPLLLRNDLALGHHWLRVKLTGSDVNRDAIGAWVEVRTGDMLQRRQVQPSRSYLSQVEPVVTFGLGNADSVDSVAVLWPDGSRQVLDAVSVDSQIAITQQP